MIGSRIDPRMLAGALALAVAGPASGAAQQWTATNPGAGGWFERIGVGPTGIVLAASDLSGPYISHDGGLSWRALGSRSGFTTTHVAGFGFHPTDPDVFYAGTEEGILRTVDGGASFDQPLTTGYVETLAFAAADPLVGYAGWHSAFDVADGVIYKTVDGGATWAEVSLDLPGGLRILKIVVESASADNLYLLTGVGRFAAGPSRLFRSTSGGAQWTAIDGPFSERLLDVAADKFTAGTLWASVDDADPDAPGHLYRSFDRGTTWSHVVQHGGYVWLDAGDPLRVRMFDSRYQFDFPGEDRDGFFETLDGGATWSRISSVDAGTWEAGWSEIFWRFTGEPHGVAEDPSDPDNLYWVNTQFLYATRDRGLSAGQVFTSEVGGAGTGRWLSRGVDNVVIIELEASQTDPDTAWAGFIDLGLWRTRDRGGSWMNCNLPSATGNWEGYGGNTWTVLTDPIRPGHVWAPQSEDEEGPGTLLRTTTSGGADCADWQAAGTGLPAAPLLGLSLDGTRLPGGNRTLYVTAAGDVWKSVDDGDLFSNVLSNGGLRTTLVDPHDGDVVYAGGESGFFRSADAGSSWSEVGLPAMRGSVSGLPFDDWEGVYGIAADPSRPGWIYVAARGPGRGLFRSTDRGDTWDSPLLGDDFLYKVAVHPHEPDLLLATSSSVFDRGGFHPSSGGVWRSSDGGSSWQPHNDGLEWPFAVPIAITSDGADLWVGSPGTGVHLRNAAGGEIFTDGFESGDVGRWQ